MQHKSSANGKKLPVDYEAIFAGYCKGLQLNELATQYSINPGTLRAYASRNDWQQRAAEARKALQRSMVSNLSAQGEKFASRISGLLDKQLTTLENRDPNSMSIKDWEAFTHILERTCNVGRTNYGMDAGQGASSRGVLMQVNIASNGQVRTGYTSSASPEQLANLQRISLDLPASDELAIEQAS